MQIICQRIPDRRGEETESVPARAIDSLWHFDRHEHISIYAYDIYAYIFIVIASKQQYDFIKQLSFRSLFKCVNSLCLQFKEARL